MPLINCPDCGNSISDRAPSCIHCGAPMGSQAATKLPMTPFAKLLALALVAACGVIAYRLYVLAYPPLQTPTAEQLIEQTAEPDLSTYTGGAYAQALMKSEHAGVDVKDKRTFALMNERQLMMNKSTPRLLNPLLTLRDVNYRHSEKSIDYNYTVNDQLDIRSIDDLKQSLHKRYCEAEEYALMRELNVEVVWRYWNKSGMLLKTITSGRC